MTDISDSSRREKILLRIRQASDFPAMAETVSVINKFKASEDTSVSELANILLKDYALTTKILKVVNSVHFMQSGQVTTISRAIFLMGIDHIKSIALTLMLFDRLQKHTSQTEMMDAVMQAFCGGVIARRIVEDLNYIEEEEAFICALLHPLGKIIVAHTMPEKIVEIRKVSAERSITEEQASTSVLGISYEQIGTTIATEWNYPQMIVQSMRHLAAADVPASPQESAKLSLVATVSTEMSNILATNADKKEKERKISGLLATYRDNLPARPRHIEGLIKSSVKDFNDLATAMDLNLKQSSFGEQLATWTETGAASASDAEILSFRTDSLKTIDTLFGEEKESPEAVFSKGIQDINNSMLGPYALNDIIHIALETIYRGLQTSQVLRVLFFVKDIKRPQMEIRFGFGNAVNEAKKWFIVYLSEDSGIFNMAVSRDMDLVVKDAASPEIRKFIPSWYRNNAPADGYILLFPVSIHKKNIGLVSIEGSSKGYLNISRSYLSYLKILRDQIVIATRQSLRQESNRPPDR